MTEAAETIPCAIVEGLLNTEPVALRDAVWECAYCEATAPDAFKLPWPIVRHAEDCPWARLRAVAEGT